LWRSGSARLTARASDESFGQSSIEQEAADAPEPEGAAHYLLQVRAKLLNGTLTDAYRVANPVFRGTPGFAQAVH
jgi:hypothetical protein